MTCPAWGAILDGPLARAGGPSCPVGVIVQTAAMFRARVLPPWQLGLLGVSLLLIGFPDGAEIVNLTAALLMTAAKAKLITGMICGVRVEDVPDPLMRKIRQLDKLVDELARGKKLESILGR